MGTRDGFTGPVNLGNPDEFTILELAKKVLQLTGSKSELVFKGLPEDDPMQRKPDISLANRELGWKPSVALDDGLRRTINYFQNASNTSAPASPPSCPQGSSQARTRRTQSSG